MKAYLCGPILGCTDSESKTWREWFKENFVAKYYDPMDRDYRGKELENDREIVVLDKRDILLCDVIIVMYTKPSVGTSMEIFFAWSKEIPVIVINESTTPISPWLKYHSTTIVNSKEEACNKLKDWFKSGN